MPTKGSGLIWDPKSSWWAATTPTTQVTLSAFTWVGIEFEVTQTTYVYGLRTFINNGGIDELDLGVLWNQDTRIFYAAHAFYQAAGFSPPHNAWMQLWFGKRVKIFAGNTYRAAVVRDSTYDRTPNALTSPVTHGRITLAHGWQSTAIAPWAATLTLTAHANGVDILEGLK